MRFMNTTYLRVLPPKQAAEMGYSRDRRKRRHQHRAAARKLMGAGSLLSPGRTQPGSNIHGVVVWHLFNARFL